jgi:hypothetical protein
MRTITFTYELPLELRCVPSALLLKKANEWARRRPYVLDVSVLPDRVTAVLETPNNAVHNRAVNALGKILTNTIERWQFDNNTPH